jgi:hypothetical protein
LFIKKLEPPTPNAPAPPAVEPAVPLNRIWLVIPVSAAALSLRLFAPFPVSGEMLSTK